VSGVHKCSSLLVSVSDQRGVFTEAFSWLMGGYLRNGSLVRDVSSIAIAFRGTSRAGVQAVDTRKERSENLDVILTYVKERGAAQNAQITSLDGKANFGLAAASLLTTGVASLHAAFLSAQRLDPSRGAGALLFPRLDPQIFAPIALAFTALAFATYVVVVFSAYQAYKVRGYTTVPNAKTLLNEYWTSPAFDTKARLAATMAEVIEENEHKTDAKAWWVRVVMRSLLVEAALLLLLLVLQLTV
jgi:hypothetical protein